MPPKKTTDATKVTKVIKEKSDDKSEEKNVDEKKPKTTRSKKTDNNDKIDDVATNESNETVKKPRAKAKAKAKCSSDNIDPIETDSFLEKKRLEWIAIGVKVNKLREEKQKLEDEQMVILKEIEVYMNKSNTDVITSKNPIQNESTNVVVSLNNSENEDEDEDEDEDIKSSKSSKPVKSNKNILVAKKINSDSEESDTEN